MVLSDFYCNTCGVPICGLDQFESHIRGKQHAKHSATLAVQKSNKPHLQSVRAGHSQWTDDLEFNAKSILTSSLAVQFSENAFDWETHLQVVEDYSDSLYSNGRFIAELMLPLKDQYVAMGSGSTKKAASQQAAVDACKHLSSLGLLLVPTGLDGSIKTESMRVASEYFGRIIGPQGTIIKRLMEQSCTFIKIPSKYSGDDHIKITGDRAAIDCAKALITQTSRQPAAVSSSYTPKSIVPSVDQHLRQQPEPPPQAKPVPARPVPSFDDSAFPALTRSGASASAETSAPKPPIRSYAMASTACTSQRSTRESKPAAVPAPSRAVDEAFIAQQRAKAQEAHNQKTRSDQKASPHK